jgi:hypothetical protein
MRLFQVRTRRRLIVAAIVAVEFAIVTHRPEFWLILCFALGAFALARELWCEDQWFARVDFPEFAPLRSQRFQSLRHMLIAAGFAAIVMWPVHLCLFAPYYVEKARFHALMSSLCAAEATIMEGRAYKCSARAAEGVAWDEPGEDAEDLKICPYPSDVPRYGSWYEQQAVWLRAAKKSRKAARRHALIFDYCAPSNLPPPPGS